VSKNTPFPEQDPQTSLPRSERFTSHALVEVRKYKILPFFVKSAVLLDISLGGFKLEFTGEVSCRPGDQYWLNVPLTPLGIYAPSRLMMLSEVRWFDERRYRIGGTFIDLTDTDRLVIEQILESLKKRGFLL
jgi:hypothetical protein